MRPIRILLPSIAALALATLTLTGCGPSRDNNTKRIGNVTISLVEGPDGHEYMVANGTSITHAQGCKTCAKK